MKFTLWKYLSAVMVLVLALGAGVNALMPGPITADAPPLMPWADRYSEGCEDSQATGIALDGSGNIYVTGWSENCTTSSIDFATIKYSPSGARVWVARYSASPPGEKWDSAASDIALDGSGNVYVTGWGDHDATDTSTDFVTVKYETSTGAQQWVQRYWHGKESRANAIAVDGDGVYVTGWSDNTTDPADPTDIATIKYDTSTGAQQWIARYSASYTGQNRFSEGNDIAIVGSGIYVTGFSDNISDISHKDFATIKYASSTGAQQWVQRYWNGNQSIADAIAVDVNGVYVTGWSDNITSGHKDFATVKYATSTGAQQWVQRYSASTGDSEGNDIALDNYGNAYVTGYRTNEAGGVNTDYATIKYDTSGAQQWVGRYRNGDRNSANAIAVDCSSSNVYVTGWSDNITSGFYDYASVKYDTSTGTQQWVARYASTGNSVGNDIAVDCCGNVYVTGFCKNLSNHDEYATIKYLQQPTVTAVNPVSGQSGTTIPVIITGTNFTNPSTVSFSGAGVTASNVHVVSPAQLTADITIASTAAVGARDVTVTNACGLGGTGIALFTVIAAPPPPSPLPPPPPSIGTETHGAGTGVGTTQAYSWSPPTTIPIIIVQSASLSAKTVTPGTPITVTADITNRSTVNGSKKVTLYVNGQEETSQGLAVNSGGSTQLTFNVSRSEPGDYTVYVDGVPAGSFKVEVFRESDGILIFSAVLIAVAFILGMVMLRRRQRN